MSKNPKRTTESQQRPEQGVANQEAGADRGNPPVGARDDENVRELADVTENEDLTSPRDNKETLTSAP